MSSENWGGVTGGERVAPGLPTRTGKRRDISSRTLLLGLLLALSCFYINLARDSYTDDFRAFYLASATVHDHLDPYVNHLDLGEKYADALWVRTDSRFIYPPTALLFASPLAWVPYKWSKIAFGATMTLIMVGILWGLHRRFPRQTLTLLALFLTLPMFMNIDNGNADILILALTLAAFYLADGMGAGICLGIAVSIKFAPILLVLWFLTERRWRTIVWSLATSIVLGIIAWLRWGGVYYREFFSHLARHANDGMSTVAHTFQTVSIVHYRAIIVGDEIFSYQHDIGGYLQNPLRFLGHFGGIAGATILLSFTIWLLMSQTGRRLGRERSFFLFLVVMLLVNPLLWTMGLVACFPLIVLLANDSYTPRMTALLLLVPFFLTKQIVGEQNFLIWLLAAGYCLIRSGWFSSEWRDRYCGPL